MKLMAAFLILIPAVLLIGLAYHGYAESASISTLSGGDFEHFASRASDGFSIEAAERQSKLVIAGMEGLLGLVFLYTALSLSASSRKREVASPSNRRRDRSPLPYSQRTGEAQTPIYSQAGYRHEEASRSAKRTLVQSGRARIEELRRARNRRRNAEKA
jgi:hypothetical protein